MTDENAAITVRQPRVGASVFTKVPLPEDSTFKVELPTKPGSMEMALAFTQDHSKMIYIPDDIRLRRFVTGRDVVYVRARMFKKKLYIIHRVEGESW